MAMTLKERALLRADYLRGTKNYYRWLDDRLAEVAAPEAWTPVGKVAVPPDKATIRNILAEGVLGGKSLTHLCVVFKTTPAFWYLDDEATIYEAARTIEQVGLVVSPEEADEWLAKRSAPAEQAAAPEEKPHQRGAEMAAAFI